MYLVLKLSKPFFNWIKGKRFSFGGPLAVFYIMKCLHFLHTYNFQVIFKKQLILYMASELRALDLNLMIIIHADQMELELRSTVLGSDQWKALGCPESKKKAS